jgi:hypothetical protein
MKNKKTATYTGVIILCAISLFFLFPEKTVINAPSVASIYEFPKNALTLLDVTKHEDFVLQNEKRNKWIEGRRDVAIVAAYEIVPVSPYAFSPVRIVITSLGKFPSKEMERWEEFEKKREKNKNEIPPKFAAFLLRYERLFVRHRENDGSESGVYASDSISMSGMNDDGSFSLDSYTGSRAFIFENHNAKKKYSFRIIQSTQMTRSSGVAKLRPIKGGEKYYANWHSPKGAIFEENLELTERVDFNYIFNSLKELTINHIAQTGVVEKFYAEREAKRKKETENAQK